LAGAENALDRADRALLVEILLGFLAEREAAVAAHGDDGGGPFLAFAIGEDVSLSVLKVCDYRIAGAEIDADVGHFVSPLWVIEEYGSMGTISNYMADVEFSSGFFT